MSEAETKPKISAAEASRINHRAKLNAVAGAIQGMAPVSTRQAFDTAQQVLEALQGVQYVVADDCEAETPYGACEQDWGHEGPHYTYEYRDPNRPNGSHAWDY